MSDEESTEDTNPTPRTRIIRGVVFTNVTDTEEDTSRIMPAIGSALNGHVQGKDQQKI
jgi:hypothetical protein